MSVLAETQQLLDLFEQVEEIESVADTLPADDQRRTRLIGVVERALAKAPPVRPVVAGELLDLTEKTVRAWAQEGVLTVSHTSPRMLLDAGRLHQVVHLVADLRRAGKTRGLLDEVYRRLAKPSCCGTTGEAPVSAVEIVDDLVRRARAPRALSRAHRRPG